MPKSFVPRWHQVKAGVIHNRSYRRIFESAIEMNMPYRLIVCLGNYRQLPRQTVGFPAGNNRLRVLVLRLPYEVHELSEPLNLGIKKVSRKETYAHAFCSSCYSRKYPVRVFSFAEDLFIVNEVLIPLFCIPLWIYEQELPGSKAEQARDDYLHEDVCVGVLDSYRVIELNETDLVSQLFENWPKHLRVPLQADTLHVCNYI